MCTGVGHSDSNNVSMRSTRSRLVATALAGAFVLAACGGGDDSESGGGSSAASDGTQLPAPADDTSVDPASDTAENVLPDVVVDDVGAGNKVNLRNVSPSDKPVLLWMYAPH